VSDTDARLHRPTGCGRDCVITQAMEEKEKKLEMELHAEMEAIEVDRKELQYLPP